MTFSGDKDKCERIRKEKICIFLAVLVTIRSRIFKKESELKLHDMQGTVKKIELIVMKMVHRIRNIERWFATIARRSDMYENCT